MGRIERKIVKDAMRSGAPIPDRIKNAPELEPSLQLFISGFFDLDSCRNANGFAIGSIPWSEIATYAKFYDMPTDQAEDFIYVVSELDKAYVAKESEKQRAKEKQHANAKKPSKRN